MKRSLHIDFVPGGRLRLLTDLEVRNEQSMVRSVAMNLVSKQGEDVIFPDRGTDIGWGSFRGAVLSVSETGSAAKFAALDTLYFLRTHSNLDSADKPEQITLVPESISASSITLLLSCETVDGRIVSYNLKK